MSDIVEALKDAVNPSRREQATGETYDASKRGPYADQGTVGDGQPELSPPSSEAHHPGRAEQTDLSGGSTTSQAANTSGQSSTKGTQTAHEGTCGRRRSSAAASAVDPRGDDYGGAISKPLHTEGGKYGLS